MTSQNEGHDKSKGSQSQMERYDERMRRRGRRKDAAEERVLSKVGIYPRKPYRIRLGFLLS